VGYRFSAFWLRFKLDTVLSQSPLSQEVEGGQEGGNFFDFLAGIEFLLF
jgi:hypothetical protein